MHDRDEPTINRMESDIQDVLAIVNSRFTNAMVEVRAVSSTDETIETLIQVRRQMQSLSEEMDDIIRRTIMQIEND